MATVDFTRYDLDPTGVNQDNLVAGEVRDIGVMAKRACATKYGPFYTASMVIYDHLTNRLLDRGIDYELVDLVQEPTLLYSQEIMQMILVTNSQVSSQIRTTYQVLGGLYQNNSEGLIELYNAAINDNRAVDWSLVANKPSLFPSTPHNHETWQIYGMGPVVVALERVRDAVVLSNIPAFEALMEWVRIYSGGAILFDPVVTQMTKSQSQTFNIQTANVPNGTKLYWTVDHNGTTSSNFVADHGEFTMFQNRGSFTISTSSAPPEDNQPFNISLRSGSALGPSLNVIEGIIYIGEHVVPPIPDGEQSVLTLFNSCCLYNPDVEIDAMSLYILGGR